MSSHRSCGFRPEPPGLKTGRPHCAKDPIALTDEGVVPVPPVHAEILVEVVGDGVPGDELPAHPLLQALDLGLRGARDTCQRRVPRV